MRRVKKVHVAWLLAVCFVVYLFFAVLRIHQRTTDRTASSLIWRLRLNEWKINKPAEERSLPESVHKKWSRTMGTTEANRSLLKDTSEFLFQISSKNISFYGEEVLNLANITLAERMKCTIDKKARKRLILLWELGIRGSLSGCPDWKCELTTDREKIHIADAILLHAPLPIYRHPDQYLVFYSQESPQTQMFFDDYSNDMFNMSLGFRHDSPVTSPYGYAVKLAERSKAQTIDEHKSLFPKMLHPKWKPEKPKSFCLLK
ncbi:hypothetical protein RB195_019137 [Necator americanus]|uniref:Fucosyltransferase N-terminal domain-containing protein n=1 Tax=Necator americanus TaxID=51031 RepID=A0ABR1CEK3_NECAM